MESAHSNAPAPSSADAPFMKLPEHVDGFVDVQTLIDIQKYLSESGQSDDVTLADWVKEQYLYEPVIEEGRQIRDTEGFVKLDAAYRRVRLLTGKAQDKWPFFHRNWKKMSSVVVKNAILGNAAMCTSRQITNGGVYNSPMSNGFDGQLDSRLHDSESQTPFGAKNPSRHQKPSQPAAPIPASQPKPEQQAQRQDLLFRDFSLSPTPETPSESRSGTKSGTTTHGNVWGVPTLDNVVDSAAAPANSSRDIRADKARGSQGRSLNNDKPSSTARKGPNIKYVKKPRSKATLDTESEEEALSSDESFQAHQDLYAVASEPSSDDVDEVTQSSSPKSNKDTQTTDSSINDSPASSILAAEAEAVPSNLDRLPPGSAGKKRKSEAAVQRGGNKRSRGSRGGMLGRPRKSESIIMDSQPNADDADEGANIKKLSSEAGSIAKMTTRRSTRTSAVSALEPPAFIEPSGRNDLREVPQQKSNETSAHLATTDLGIALGSDGSAKTKLNGAIFLNANGIDKDAKEAASGNSFSAQSTVLEAQAPGFQKAPASSKKKKRVSFSPEIDAVNVAFFARIDNSGVTEEIRLSEEDLVSGVDLVKRYAAWQKSGEASVTFETFKNIVRFAK
ncbi:hypothetical protein M3J07_000135 [Ascochyta lentis]